MPIYEYFCNACQTQSEINHRMSDPPATICPVCGKPELTKQISAAAFRLKGGGWYETDFKTDGKKNVAGGDGESGGAIAPVAGVAAGASKAGATPAAKTDAAPTAAPAPAAPAAASPAPSSSGPSSTT